MADKLALVDKEEVNYTVKTSPYNSSIRLTYMYTGFNLVIASIKITSYMHFQGLNFFPVSNRLPLNTFTHLYSCHSHLFF